MTEKMMNEIINQIDKDLRRASALSELIEDARAEKIAIDAELKVYKKAEDVLRVSIRAAKRYLSLKQKTNEKNINNNIRDVQALVGSQSDAKLVVGEKKIFIEDKVGTPIHEVEGAGYRTILGTRIKLTCLNYSGFSKIAILDEPVAQASFENSLELAKTLKVLSENMQIFYVSQDTRYLDDYDVRFEFKLGDDFKTKIVDYDSKGDM